MKQILIVGSSAYLVYVLSEHIRSTFWRDFLSEGVLPVVLILGLIWIGREFFR